MLQKKQRSEVYRLRIRIFRIRCSDQKLNKLQYIPILNIQHEMPTVSKTRRYNKTVVK